MYIIGTLAGSCIFVCTLEIHVCSVLVGVATCTCVRAHRGRWRGSCFVCLCGALGREKPLLVR